jgi:hypothetical protein
LIEQVKVNVWATGAAIITVSVACSLVTDPVALLTVTANELPVVSGGVE